MNRALPIIALVAGVCCCVGAHAVDTSAAEVAQRQHTAADLVAHGPALMASLEAAEHAARAGYPIDCDASVKCAPYAAVIGPLGRAVGESLLPVVRSLRLILPQAVQDAQRVAQPGE